ncbi:probable endochitinase [Toxorhynchites rutilus septentrionalis]|uniref:probable endochitinase n=1 Tax=Toxorhynchites rutilus septentrionalis TaxID=329112 RepID=UPI00247A4182|nr:probable endochitinase [Toxorhynchites rutilus septentrionalis]
MELIIIMVVALFATANGFSLICRNYRSGALIPNPENCSEFFMCRPGRAVKFSCPRNTRFNPVIRACDTNTAVRCIPGQLPVDNEYTPINAAPSVIELGNSACVNQRIASLLPNTRSCSTFHQCSSVGVITFECPPGTLFDANRLYCERSDTASCLIVPEIPILPIPPDFIDTEIHRRCIGQREGTKIRNPLNCRQYIHCSSGNRFQVFDCPPGTAFNEQQMVCDWERNVQC